MQGMLYVLGMERMLSPRREIPLPHAMTSYIETDNKERHSVLESNVSLEIENSQGQIITIHRPVKSQLDNRLVSVDFGPTLTDEATVAPRRNFFVTDPGAAAREDGFHYFLEHFLGWELPTVRRYDAPDGKLYLETVFPLFWVEQKSGWSAIPAAIPTYLRIRDVHKRAVEFIMDLDVHRLELQRQQVADRLATNAYGWRLRLDDLERTVRRGGAKIEGIPPRPIAVADDLDRAYLTIAEGTNWIQLNGLIAQLREKVAGLTGVAIPDVGAAAEKLTEELKELNRKAEAINAVRLSAYDIKQIKDADIGSLRRRIKSLEEDLQKNQDVLKLQRYSGATASLTPDRCPTCEQSLMDILLTQDALASVMPIEDNIEYLRSELRMFRDILAREETALSSLNQSLASADRDLTDVYARIRILRSDLISPNSSPSAATVEERVRAESRIRELEELQSALSDAIDRLRSLSEEYATLLAEQASLPDDKMSQDDKRKLSKLTRLVRDQAKQFGFSTFDPEEVSISDDTYRPQKEGFEIGFETSASDAIRLKWAYQLGLLELGTMEKTNHPGLLVFDEPRQQSSAKVSFEHLLERASESLREKRQVIFSTSEDLANLELIVAGLDCETLIFKGYMIQRIA
jgi:predicted  nucleic acid-binding Zn-ribbon protein